MSLLFFSYARRDDGPELQRFYDDLVEELASLKGKLENEVAFRDVHMQLGSTWTEELRSALGNCSVMLCLYSPYYFRSVWCAKEWTHFRERVLAYTDEEGLRHPPPLQIPVIWNPVNPPESASVLQYSHEDFGPLYDEKGLRYLVQIESQRDTYRRVVRQLADAMVRGLNETPLPPSPSLPDFERIDPAFDVARRSIPPRAARRRSRRRSSSLRRGPRHVIFFIAAPTYQDIEPHRENLEPYDDTVFGWRPYYPPSEEEIGPFTQELAGSIKCTSQIVGPEEDFVEHLTRAEENKNLAIVLLDPWASQVEHTRERLAALDGRLFWNERTLLLWNEEDEETVENEEALMRQLQACLRNRMDPDRPLVLDIRSPRTLRTQLRKILEKLRAKIIAASEPVRIAGSRGERILRPVISASSEDAA